MAKKKVNRKKQLKKQFAALRKAGKLVGNTVAETAQTVAHQASDVTAVATEKINEVVEIVKEKVEEGKAVVEKVTKKSEASLEDLTNELTGLAVARVETFYAEGICTAKDFASWTEKELLELKGIGPATLKKLKEIGITFKA
ncbi:MULTISPECIES: helix-hairpin-helix domain-containing protein [Streptococcus]|uniref:Helix-hairpin-helix domain-containing protein n=1 Tax=Streptococcus caledonicus TaxID=2614158 RepID=A0ABW0UC53_9STRE|nr:helix-hairpin-helix domain-containing protein [Streptococcus sp. S784/96/1]